MKLAVISDVHGNLQALEAILVDIKTTAIEELIFLGDAVGYGANPNEVVQLIADECKLCIMGNHDSCAIGLTDAFQFNVFAKEALEFTMAVLNQTTKTLLSKFEMTHQLSNILLTHATPQQPAKWDYCFGATQAREQFNHFDSQICFIGHSHWPVIFARNSSAAVTTSIPTELTLKPDYKYLVNVGSVGQPRDGDPRACYVIYDTDKKHLNYRRVAYDIASAQNAMVQHNLPRFLVDRLANGR